MQYTPPDRWDTASAAEGWTNHDVMSHLAAGEMAAAATLAGEPAEVFDQFRRLEGTFDLAAFNARAVEERRDRPLREVVAEWGTAADGLLARASKLDDEAWSGRRVFWVFGDVAPRHLIQSRISEWWIHGEDIRAGAGLPNRLEHPPIWCVNDLAIRMLPYVLGLAGLDRSGRSVRIGLAAAGGGVWHRGLAPGEKPAADKVPDAYIDSRAYPFAMVAAARVPAEYYVDDGTFAIGGDEDLAWEVLEHLRATG